MPNGVSGQSPAGNSDSNPLPPPLGNPAVEQNDMTQTPNGGTENKDTETRHLLKSVKNGELALLILNGLLLVLTIIIACIYNGQLNQMTEATKATKDAVQVARDTLSETQTSNMLQTAMTIQGQISSEANAKNSLDATIDNFHQEQRAWVGLSPLQNVPIANAPINNNQFFQKEPNASPPMHHEFGIVNTGHTPARHVSLFYCEDVSSTRYTPDAKDAAWMNRFVEAHRQGHLKGKTIIIERIEGTDQIGPAVVEDSALLPPRSVNKYFQGPWEEINLGSLTPNIPFPTPIRNGRVYTTQGTILFFGEVRYYDIYSKSERTTTFCTYTDRTLDYNFSACPVFNDMQ